MEIIYRHFTSLASTNDWAKKHLDTFSRDALTVITAETQTQGRGRYGRRWVSPAGVNLYTTFLFFADSPDALSLTHLLALTTAQLLETKNIAAQIKWPNDLMVHRKKIGGILCEITADHGIVIGIGLNVNMAPEECARIDQPATSLLCETGSSHEIAPLLQDLAIRFASHLKIYLAEGFTPFSPLFQARLIGPANSIDSSH